MYLRGKDIIKVQKRQSKHQKSLKNIDFSKEDISKLLFRRGGQLSFFTAITIIGFLQRKPLKL